MAEDACTIHILATDAVYLVVDKDVKSRIVVQRDVRVLSSSQRRGPLPGVSDVCTPRAAQWRLPLCTLASSAPLSLTPPRSPRWCITSFFIDCRRGIIALSRFRTTRVVRFVFYPASVYCCITIRSVRRQAGQHRLF
jgi:hypothetical protein